MTRPNSSVTTLWGSLESCGRLSIGPLPNLQPAGGGNQPPRRLSTCPTSMAQAVCTAVILLTTLATAAFSQTADLAPVVSKLLARTADLPGEFQPYLTVSLHARVAGYVAVSYTHLRAH